jgi:hypothetical protein
MGAKNITLGASSKVANKPRSDYTKSIANEVSGREEETRRRLKWKPGEKRK